MVFSIFSYRLQFEHFMDYLLGVLNGFINMIQIAQFLEDLFISSFLFFSIYFQLHFLWFIIESFEELFNIIHFAHFRGYFLSILSFESFLDMIQIA